MKKEVETRISHISLEVDGILRVRIKDIGVVKEADVIESFDIYRKWGCDKKKVLQIMYGNNFFSMDSAGQKYAAKHGNEIFLASAMVHKSIAIRVLFNFFIRFFRTDVPMRIFSDEKSAVQWLENYRQA